VELLKVGDGIRLVGRPFSLKKRHQEVEINPGDVGIVKDVALQDDVTLQTLVLWGGSRVPYWGEALEGCGHMTFPVTAFSLVPAGTHSATFWEWRQKQQVDYQKEVPLWDWSGIAPPVPPLKCDPFGIENCLKNDPMEPIDWDKLKASLALYGFLDYSTREKGVSLRQGDYRISQSWEGWESAYLDSATDYFYGQKAFTGYVKGLEAAVNWHLAGSAGIPTP